MADKAANLGSALVKNVLPHIKTFLWYAKTEMTPPKISDFPAAISGFNRLLSGAKSGAWKQTTVKEGFRNFLVTAEVLCWFYVGECIGKRRLVGYKC